MQLVRMLMRSPISNADPLVYNDFVKIEDFVGICRKLWKGQMILGHDGPAQGRSQTAIRG